MKLKLKEIYLFKELDDKTLTQMESFTSLVKLSKDNIVFYEGEESKYLIFLRKGIIKLYKTTSTDKEIIMKYFHQNEFIAEVANFEQIPYPATAQAFTEAEVLKIDFKEFKKLIYSDLKLSFIIQTSLIKKIRNLENLISSNMVLDAKERIAKYLCEHTEDFFNTKNLVIAEILNISPETLSRTLKIFKEDGLINSKDKTINKEMLERIFL